MNKKHLKSARIENYSTNNLKLGKIPVLKKHQYFIIEGYTITGDAPKEFIRAYEYGTVRKRDWKNWPLFIAKTGHKWYPSESITEYLLNKLGCAFNMNMSESKIVFAGNQIRFLSKYFLNNDEELIHGAELYAGYLGDKDFVEEIENKDLARDFFTLQFTQDAIKYAYPYHYEGIMEEFIKMILFDALVGNNDRHFYNWGIIRHLERDHAPRFAPIYDTARGLFWNSSDDKIFRKFRNKNELDLYIKKYAERSKPKIGWEGENNINHFNLVYNIHKHEFGISKSDIYDLFLQKRFKRLIEVVNRDFVELFSKQRRELITRCLNYRYRRIIELIG